MCQDLRLTTVPTRSSALNLGFSGAVRVSVRPATACRYDVSRISLTPGYFGTSAGYCATTISPNTRYVAPNRFDDPAVNPNSNKLSARLLTVEPPNSTSTP